MKNFKKINEVIPNGVSMRIMYALLSGGIDSVVATYKAVKEIKPDMVKAVFISRKVEYADVHRAYKWEIHYARVHARKLQIPEDHFYEIHIPFSWYAKFKQKYREMYPYGRNLIYLGVAASFASMDVYCLMKTKSTNEFKAFIITGFNLDDGHDSKEDFVNLMNEVIALGTYKEYYSFKNSEKLIVIYAPFINKHKCDIIKYALENELEWVFTESWSCYNAGEIHCGTCDGCEKRKNAFKDANIKDPTKYKD